MTPPSAPAVRTTPGECATMASGCTLSTSPPSNSQRAMAFEGLWRILTCKRNLLATLQLSSRASMDATAGRSSSAARSRRGSAFSQSMVGCRETIASGRPERANASASPAAG